MGGVAKIGNSIGSGFDSLGNKIQGTFGGIGGNGFGSTLGRGLEAGVTGGLSEFTRSDPFGVPGANPFNSGTPQNSGISGPFSLDPNQVTADQAALTGLGTQQQQATGALGQSQFGQANDLASQQYQQTLGLIPGQVSQELNLENPMIMENLNKGGLLTSSAYPTEIARQQALLTAQLAIPAEQQFQQQQQGAQAGLFGAQQQGLNTAQGLQTGAVQRGLSLEDQINNANISKTIGQAFAPQPPSGKAQFGTAAQGVGALSPWFAKGGALGKAA